MGFFKDFKDDFDEAMSELVPEDEEMEEEFEDEEYEDDEEFEEEEINTVEEDIDVQNELSKIDGLLESVSAKTTPVEEEEEEDPMPASSFSSSKLSFLNSGSNSPAPAPSAPAPTVAPTPSVMNMSTPRHDAETAVITEGMIIHGSVESAGSVEVQGVLDGDITCSGKLIVTGEVKGNSVSAEFYADAAKVQGEVNTTGTVKIGNGSVIIGNIQSSSAVIAGAVKGDIDVNGPVVVDTSAVVMGNIKSKSVQINNGAVIEGFCSQSYSDVNMADLFGN